MSETHTKVLEAHNKVWEEAKKLFGVTGNLCAYFDLRGTSAGMACKQFSHFFVRYNAEACDKYLQDTITETVPHEIAHIVCYMRPELGKNHDKGWKRVCMQLGGSAKRTHDLKLNKARATTVFRYRGTCGSIIEVGGAVHKRIQNGRTYVLKKTKGKLLAENWIRDNAASAITPVIKPSPTANSIPQVPTVDVNSDNSLRKVDIVRTLIVAFKNMQFTLEQVLQDNAKVRTVAKAAGLDLGRCKRYIERNWSKC